MLNPNKGSQIKFMEVNQVFIRQFSVIIFTLGGKQIARHQSQFNRSQLFNL